MGDSYVVKGAKLKCSFGDQECSLQLMNHDSKIKGKEQANIMDFAPMMNVPPFGMCNSMLNPALIAAKAASNGAVQKVPCIPVIPAPWLGGKVNKMVKGPPALLKSSTLMCAYMGQIKIQDDGMGGHDQVGAKGEKGKVEDVSGKASNTENTKQAPQGKYTREYIQTLPSISDNFDERLARHNLTKEEFEAIKLTRKEFLDVTEKEIADTFESERAAARANPDLVAKPDHLAQRLKLIDDEQNTVMKCRPVLQKLTPDQRKQKYQNLIDLRNEYEAPTEDTLMAKYCSIDDALGYFKEKAPFNEIGGYNLKAGDTKTLNNFDDVYNTLRLDYVGNNFNSKTNNLVEILYKTDDVKQFENPIDSPDPWPCTHKAFLANTNEVVEPEYKLSKKRVKPSEGEAYLVNGKTGERTKIADYIPNEKRFVPVDKKYWTEDTVKSLKGE